ncbi:MAG: 30S ribosomal protein S12 methylthiotransferase RimO [Deinococcales bacterium]|nr:30S ribosomal protein S12 methylthiotransferase RimO [Deinococcales bacterium]
MSGKIGFVSLGCPKALIDSEHILTQLRAEGYELVPTFEDADLVVVNTCGFITPAVEESLETIGNALESNGRVVVTGCLGERPEVIMERHPNVLSVTGQADLNGVMSAVHNALPPELDPFKRLIPNANGIKLTPRHYSYLKIAEGCNHTCSFCIIPQLRGLQISRDASDILVEATRLVATGTRELIVISQDSSAYGSDLRHRESTFGDQKVRAHLVPLVEELAELGIWIRLHYIYPYPHVRDIIPLMAEGKVLPYLDVPLQHASPSILKAMRRPGGPESHLKTISEWRSICPDLTIRSTFIVGFPGETPHDFELLLDFLREARLEKVGAFTYSAVDGAAANDLGEPIPEELSRERRARLMECQQKISEEKNCERVGTNLEVIIDAFGDLPGEVIGRTLVDSPEIDGSIVLKTDGTVKIGDRVLAKVTGATSPYDLEGKLIKSLPWTPTVPQWN